MIHNDDLVQILRKLSADLRFAADRVQYCGGFGASPSHALMLRACARLVDYLVKDMERYGK